MAVILDFTLEKTEIVAMVSRWVATPAVIWTLAIVGVDYRLCSVERKKWQIWKLRSFPQPTYVARQTLYTSSLL